MSSLLYCINGLLSYKLYKTNPSLHFLSQGYGCLNDDPHVRATTLNFTCSGLKEFESLSMEEVVNLCDQSPTENIAMTSKGLSTREGERKRVDLRGVLWVSYRPTSHTLGGVELFSKIMHL